MRGKIPTRSNLAGWLGGGCVAALGLAMGGAAHAQASAAAAASPDNQVETLVVTAEKRPEDIQNVPMSVSAVSGATLERQNITTVQQLSQFVPSLQIVTSNNVRDTTASIRGIGSSGANPGIETDVGIFVDGVYMPQGGVVQNNLLDISTIEILRGPQGTLYGRNTSAGAISINTRAPTQTFEAMGDVQFGNYDERRFSGYVGGGLTDTLAARLSVFSEANGGYEKNLYDGGMTDDSQSYGGRARFLWTPTSAIDVNVIAYDTEMSSHCCLAVHINPAGVGGIATPGFLAGLAKEGETFPTQLYTLGHYVDSPVVPDNSSEILGGSVSADWRLANGLTLTSITAFNRFKDDLYNQPGADIPVDVNDVSQFLTTDSFSQELRVTSPTGHFLEYVAGLYAFWERISYETAGRLGPGANRVFPGNNVEAVGDGSSFTFGQRTESWAAYGQGKLNITPWFRVLFGGRYNYDHKAASFAGADYPNDSAFFLQQNPVTPPESLSQQRSVSTWLLGLQADLTHDVMAYATASTGYKDAGYNARAAGPGYPLQFGPETTTNYEIGVKSQWFDHRLLLNADVYDMFVNGLQQTVYASYLNPPAFIVGNAGNIEVRGVELEAKATPIEHLSLGANLNYNDGKFTDYHSGNCPSYPGAYLPVKTGTVCDYTGLTPSQMPKWTWNVSAEWSQALPWGPDLRGFVGGDVNYTSSQYLDATLDPRSFQRAVTLLDAHLGFESRAQNWRVQLYGRNLTNEVYLRSSTSLPQAANISGGGTSPAQGWVGWLAQPRTYGVELTKRF